MKLFDLLSEWLPARLRRRENPPQPDARRDDFPSTPEAVSDARRMPLVVWVGLMLAGILLVLLVLLAVLFIL